MTTDSILIVLVAIVVVLSAIQFFRSKAITPSDNNQLIEELKTQIIALNKELETRKNENQSLNNCICDKEVAIAEIRKDFTRSEERHKQASGELLKSKCDNSELLSTHAESVKSLNSANNDLQNALTKISDSEKAILDLKFDKKQLLEQTEKLNQKLLETSKQQVETGSELSALTNSRKEENERSKTRENELVSDIGTLKTEILELKKQILAFYDEKNRLSSDNSRLKSEHDAQQQKQEELAKAFEEQKTNLREEMSNTMQKILEGKMVKFDETSAKALETLLKPFKENIDGFRKKVEESQKESGERVIALSKEIEQVMKAGLSITAEAANLTKALKGEKQTQGRWGEMVLESVLEQSGLIKGDHYRIQENYKDDEGKDKRPDVVVKLPQDRSIIIDSKVSLVDYDRFIRSESEEERTISLVAIAKAFRNHIDTLHGKDYAHYDAGTLQYVFMFVPIESVYAVAVQQDTGLYEHALKKHIIIVYPSTLVVTLKTIYMYWQREKSDVAVEAIFEESGKLYDKVHGFVETFEKIGKQLETAAGSYQKARTQLFDGSGNILTRTEKLKELGAKTAKSLRSLKVKNSELDEDDMEFMVANDDIPLLEKKDD